METSRKDIIHVAFSLWDPKGTYCRHAGAAIVSVMSSTSSPLCFHILHDDTLSALNKNKLQETVRRFNQEIKFVNVSLPKEWGIEDSHVSRYTKATLYRLLLPDLISSDKIIHLDCDIILTTDIREFWDFLDNEHSLAARLSLRTEGFSRFSKLGAQLKYCGISLEVSPGGAFLIFNLKRIRERYPAYGARCADFFKSTRNIIKNYDEILLGAMFKNDILGFPSRLYEHVEIKPQEETCGKVFHLARKPWEGYSSKADTEYWKALRSSAWGYDEEEFMSYVFEAMAGQYSHSHTRDCIKKLGRQFYRNVEDAISSLWAVLYWNAKSMM